MLYNMAAAAAARKLKAHEKPTNFLGGTQQTKNFLLLKISKDVDKKGSSQCLVLQEVCTFSKA